jgi:hypothetical protein
MPYDDYYYGQDNWQEPNKGKNRLLGIFIHGVILVAFLVAFQFILNTFNESFVAYMPPIGFAIFIAVSYFIEPIFIGVLNIFIIHRMCNCKGWQVGFWLNGVFLLLAFMTVNLLLQTVLGLDFYYIALIDVALLSLPLGAAARFSNGGWKKPID